MDGTTRELGARLRDPGRSLRLVERHRPGDPSALPAAPADVLMDIGALVALAGWAPDESAAPSTAPGRFTRVIEQSLRSHDPLEAAR